MRLPWLRPYQNPPRQPFPQSWLACLEANVPHYRCLSAEEQAMLRDDLRAFLTEKLWEGCGGLLLTDEIKVTISAQACLLTLNLPHKFYPNVSSILVYPVGYRAADRECEPGGVVTENQRHRGGEAWSGSWPVVLSWSNVVAGGANPADGHNIVFHEFAHKLDMSDGAADGVPPLLDQAAYDRWARVMRAEYQALVDASREGHAALLDDYGATEPAEFFAVATEVFFERPVEMRARHPRLYEVLCGYYRQAPATRVDAYRTTPAGAAFPEQLPETR